MLTRPKSAFSSMWDFLTPKPEQGDHKPEKLVRISLNMENSGNSQGILCNLRGKL